jgi:hypothetical protein
MLAAEKMATRSKAELAAVPLHGHITWTQHGRESQASRPSRAQWNAGAAMPWQTALEQGARSCTAGQSTTHCAVAGMAVARDSNATPIS